MRCYAGSATCTHVPPGALLISRVPPSRWARSRIERRPRWPGKASRIKACSVVFDLQNHFSGHFSQAQHDMPRVGMFDDIVERFLRDAIKRLLRIECKRWLRTEMDLDGKAVPRAQGRDVAHQSLDQPGRLQRLWMQHKEQGAHIRLASP